MVNRGGTIAEVAEIKEFGIASTNSWFNVDCTFRKRSRRFNQWNTLFENCQRNGIAANGISYN